jgi:glycosyltransferase involved in cell wall biosynthesis
LPVIASRIGALAELVEEGVTGLLFEPGNAVDLSHKMQWAMDHADEMRRMGLAARDHYVNYFTAEKNYEQLLSIYRDAIDAVKTET